MLLLLLIGYGTGSGPPPDPDIYKLVEARERSRTVARRQKRPRTMEARDRDATVEGDT